MKGQTANRECLKHPCKGWSYYEAACSLNCSCLGNFDSPGKGGRHLCVSAILYASVEGLYHKAHAKPGHLFCVPQVQRLRRMTVSKWQSRRCIEKLWLAGNDRAGTCSASYHDFRPAF